MAAIPFPCNGILVDQGNLPRVFPVFTLNYAVFLSPISIYNIILQTTTFQYSNVIYNWKVTNSENWRTQI